MMTSSQWNQLAELCELAFQELNLGHIRATQNTATKMAANPKWIVAYDGPSRPIICGPQLQMFSISKFINGQWQSFADEEMACQLFCDTMNKLETAK